MGTDDTAKMPGFGLLAAMNILFVALPAAALMYSTWSVVQAKRQVTSPREGPEKLAQFYVPYAALGGSLVVSVGMALWVRARAQKAHAVIRKYNVYARKPSTLLLSLPGMLTAASLLLIVVLDFTINQIMGQPSWIQRILEKLADPH